MLSSKEIDQKIRDGLNQVKKEIEKELFIEFFESFFKITDDEDDYVNVSCIKELLLKYLHYHQIKTNKTRSDIICFIRHNSIKKFLIEHYNLTEDTCSKYNQRRTLKCLVLKNRDLLREIYK
jgi:predicted SnoaL-like aldol condensation-catalyzing enzyme